MSQEIFMMYGPGLESAVYFPKNSHVDDWTENTLFRRFAENLEAINQAAQAEEPDIGLLEKLMATSQGLNKALQFDGLGDFHASKIRVALFQRLKDYNFSCLVAKGSHKAPPDIAAFYETAGRYGIPPAEILDCAIRETISRKPISPNRRYEPMRTRRSLFPDDRFGNHSHRF